MKLEQILASRAHSRLLRALMDELEATDLPVPHWRLAELMGTNERYVWYLLRPMVESRVIEMQPDPRRVDGGAMFSVCGEVLEVG